MSTPYATYSSQPRGTAQPARDARERVEQERRARRQAEAIDAEFEVLVAEQNTKPRRLITGGDES